jgi:hypothetical protein
VPAVAPLDDALPNDTRRRLFTEQEIAVLTMS